MNIISLFNRKGGVGKSTIALNLAVGLSRQGHTVLAIDNDAQGNSSAVLCPRDEAHVGYSTAADLYSSPSISVRAVSPTLYVLPGGPDLEDVQYEDNAASRFAKNVRALAGNFDFVIIDNNPHISNLTCGAILAATHWLVPIQAERWSVDGLASLNALMRNLRSQFPDFLCDGTFLGFVITMYSKNITGQRQIRNYLRKIQPDLLFENPLSRRTAYSDATTRGLSIFDYAPGGPEEAEFLALLTEIKNKIRRNAHG